MVRRGVGSQARTWAVAPRQRRLAPAASLVAALLAGGARPAYGAAVLDCGAGLRVHQLSLGSMKNYQYVLEHDRDAVTVDAAWDIPRIQRYVQSQGLNLVGALYTHGHFDHVGGQLPGAGGSQVQGAAELLKSARDQAKADQPLPLWIGTADVDAATLQTGLNQKAWTAVREGESLEPLGSGARVVVIGTPGHSKGSVSYYVPGRGEEEGPCSGGLLFSGDTIFIKSAGRTDLPGGSKKALLKSLSRLSGLPDAALVLAGHSYDAPPRRASIEHVRGVNQWMMEGVRQFPPHTLKSLPSLASQATPAASREL